MHLKFDVALCLALGALAVQAQTAPLLKLERKISLPEGTGKFDHFVYDAMHARLMIAATGNHSVEVLDLTTNKVAEILPGVGKPHGLAWIEDTATLYVADGAAGDLKRFKGSPLAPAGSIKLSDDADDMVYDAKTKLLYVGHGGGDAQSPGRIAVIDTATNVLLSDLAVPSHPEGLELDPAHDRILANIAGSAAIAVIDGAAHTLSATWKLTRAQDNVPLAVDDEHQLLFVACRKPARLLVLDAGSGQELADLPADAGADDIFYDTQLRRIYLIAGSGVIDLYQVEESRNVRAAGVIPTSAGAKTGLLVPGLQTLFVGAPAVGDRAASILAFSIK